MRLILPLLLITVALGLFFGLTTSLFADIDNLRITQERVQEDLDDARELSARFNTLQSEANNIPQDKLAQLDVLLPKSVNTVDLLVQINGIGQASGLILDDVKVTTEQSNRGRGNTSNISGLNTVVFDFGVTGSYSAFRQFLSDLEKNLRLVDISAISFNSVEAGSYNYNVELKTYWLK